MPRKKQKTASRPEQRGVPTSALSGNSSEKQDLTKDRPTKHFAGVSPKESK